MNIGLYSCGNTMQGLQVWQEAIAENLSQSSSYGFRRREMAAEEVPFGEVDSYASGAAARPVAGVFRPEVSYNQGQTIQTGKPTDFALSGQGFFKLREPNGSFVYTRNGSFLYNNDYEVVDARGRQLVDRNNNPITVDPDRGELHAAEDGTLSQNGEPVGRLYVADFNDKSRLTTSGTLFKVEPGFEDLELAVAEPQVRQGFLETSNVNPIKEMVQLITVSRAYEMQQRIVQGHDDRVGQAIRRLTPFT